MIEYTMRLNPTAFLRNLLAKSSLKQRKPLTKEQVAILMHFCYCNARDLYDEAVLLRDNGKHARALTLCVLALEELSKMPIALNAAFFERDDKELWDGFWRTFNSHDYKLRAAKNYGKHTPLKVVDPARWERYYSTTIPDDMPLHELKLASMYVDCYDGTPIRPNAIFEENNATLPLVFEVVKSRLEAWHQFHSTPELSTEFVEAALASQELIIEEGRLDFIANDFRKRAGKNNQENKKVVNLSNKKKPWYQTVLVAQIKEVFGSAAPYIILLLVFLLWRFALGMKFQWIEVKPLAEPEFFYRAFYSAFTFLTLGRALYYAKFYKVLHNVVVKVFGLWELYELIKWVVWLFLMYLSYEYIVPALFAVLNTSASVLYNIAALALYVLPPVGISLVLVVIYILFCSSQRKVSEQRKFK